MVEIMSEEEVTPVEEIVEEAAVEEAAPATVSQEDYNKLYFQMKQGERDLEAAKAAPVTETPADVTENTEIRLEDFDYDETKFNAALISKQVGEQVAAALEQQATVTKQAAAQKTEADSLAGFNSAASEYAATNPGYVEAINNAPGVQYTKEIQQAILQSPQGPALDHHLLSNPQVLSELSAMAPSQALMKLGQIQGGLSTAAPVKVSSAPEPIGATEGGISRPSSDPRYDENMSMDEYYAAHQANLKK